MLDRRIVVAAIAQIGLDFVGVFFDRPESKNGARAPADSSEREFRRAQSESPSSDRA